MDAQYTIVRIYLFVCRHYRGRLAGSDCRAASTSYRLVAGNFAETKRMVVMQ